VIGGIVAKKLAYRIRGVHYPMIIAAAYTGFTLYGLGFSATIPLTISTPGHALEAQMGVVALSKTIFHPVMLATAAFVLITLPILNYFLHPKPGAPVTEIDRELFRAEMEAGGGVAGWKARRAIKADRKALAEGAEKVPFATRANDSRILSAVIGVFGLVYVVQHVVRGGIIDLNFINFFILFLGILLLATPSNYLAKLTEGIGTIAGILLQFPFYAGIMALMTASGLVETIANFFVSFSTEETLPFWGLVSSFVINFFAPSGGGHWVLQGPFMIDAAQQLGADIPAASVSVQLGNAWNDLVQPFWILPALAISRLKLKDIMGYTVIAMFYIGIVYTAATLLWGFLG
jgi:short-chain fatty acids transporter